ncbi:unnamed protein product [Rhizophagus irregularis]|nr:unnamed protein product [Rhizophagus irregularis]CAB5353322.1 unnamed protein product [Rhizophagus irregularis]
MKSPSNLRLLLNSYKKKGTFYLKHRKADNIIAVVDSLNLLREAENKLKMFELSLVSAVTLLKSLESEQTISDETFLSEYIRNMKLGDKKTQWRFNEKLILLEVILEQNATENFISWTNVGTSFENLLKLKEVVMPAGVIGKFG